MPVQFQDYYETLGLKRDATEKEIKAAYRRLARKWHPDLRPAHEKDEAAEQFKRVNEAYEVLKDTEKRARYDELGKSWQQGEDFQAPPDMGGFHFNTSSGDHGDGFSDFFEMFFGRGGTGAAAGGGFRTASRRGPDVESDIELTLEDAYRGVSRLLPGGKPCRSCSNSGTAGAHRNT